MGRLTVPLHFSENKQPFTNYQIIQFWLYRLSNPPNSSVKHILLDMANA